MGRARAGVACHATDRRRRFDDPVTGLCELVGDPTFREECVPTFVVREVRVIDAP